MIRKWNRKNGIAGQIREKWGENMKRNKNMRMKSRTATRKGRGRWGTGKDWDGGSVGGGRSEEERVGTEGKQKDGTRSDGWGEREGRGGTEERWDYPHVFLNNMMAEPSSRLCSCYWTPDLTSLSGLLRPGYAYWFPCCHNMVRSNASLACRRDSALGLHLSMARR